MSKQQQNGQWSKQDKQRDRQASSRTEIYSRATEPQTDDDFLSSVNLGLGQYDRGEYWQQIDSYRKGLFADAAFSRKIVAKALRQTKRALARKDWEELSEDERTERSKREFLDERGDELWRELGQKEQGRQRQAAALKRHSGISKNWRPAFWKMLSARHEASRSRGARLLDNLFGRVSETKKEFEMNEKDDAGWLLGGNNE